VSANDNRAPRSSRFSDRLTDALDLLNNAVAENIDDPACPIELDEPLVTIVFAKDELACLRGMLEELARDLREAEAPPTEALVDDPVFGLIARDLEAGL
jgi:hypothetical protein